ncbi:MAG TPA: hypothetical protein VGP72_21155 [Planctomycetota bacterium]|jgi:uncharacterized protein (DUF697 family)
MDFMSVEGLAGLRLLVCMAKADGVLRPDERYNLEEALAGAALPDGLTIEKLLDEKNDPLLLATRIKNRDARDCVYAAVFAMAHCDKELAEPEDRLLRLLRDAWDIKVEENQALSKALDAGSGPEMTAPKDCSPQQRAEQFEKCRRRYSVLTAITGAIPIPIVPDLLIVPLQVKMVYDIAALFGQKTDKGTVQLMFETLGLGAGVRIAVSALSKLVPGWGSVVGATSAFATTYGLAKVAWTFYETEGKANMEALKPLFREQQQAGREEFAKHKDSVMAASKEHSQRLKQLAYDLQQGKITQEQYEDEIDQLD